MNRVRIMRAALFVLIFSLLVALWAVSGTTNIVFALYISAALAAIGATVMSASGRQALRRIRHHATQGWS